MEHLVRILNERDRNVVEWLCLEVGAQRVEDAAVKLAAANNSDKPFVSAVCRYLGVKPASGIGRNRTDREVGEYHLAIMRAGLRARH